MKNYIKSLLFILILFILLEIIGYSFVGWKQVFKFGFYKASAFELLQEENDTLDTIFLGDSLIYSDINPMLIWNEYGYATFDCSTPGQPIILTYDYLEAVIESQHPKVVFLGTGVIFRKLHTKPVDDIKDKIKNYIPIADHHNDWKKIDFTDRYNNVNFYKGFKYIKTTKKIKNKNYMKKTNKIADINQENYDYFKKIVELSRKNNVQIILIAIPSQKTWNYKYHNATQKLAAEFNITFVDMNLENVGIDWRTDNRDNGNHMNYKGAAKVSRWLGNYIKENNLAIDHRNDPKYESWNVAYQKYLEDIKTVY